MPLHQHMGRQWARLPAFFQCVLAAFAYATIAHLSLSLAIPGTNASPVWPPTGFAVVLLLLGGKRLWPAVTAGAFAANLIDFSAHGPLLASHFIAASSIAGGNTLEALVAAYVLNRGAGVNGLLRRVSLVLRFLVIAPLACAISASIGAETLVLTGIIPEAIRNSIWLTWWLGDLTGLLVLVPATIAWLDSAKPDKRAPNPWIAVAAVGAIAWALWLMPPGQDTQLRLYLLLLVPLLAWVTFQYGLRGGASTVLVLVSSTVLSIAHGSMGHGAGNANDLFLQCNVVITIFTVLVLLLGADIAERREAGAQPDWRATAIAWGTLTVGCALTLFLWHINANRIETDADKRLVRRSERIVTALQHRIEDYQQIIKGGANLFLGRPTVARAIWQDYVQSLQLSTTLPGVQGVGYAEVLTPATLQTHTARVRAEGRPDYTVRPPGQRDTYASITYLEPLDSRNQRAFGYDMYSEPTRRRAMDQARDTGAITASGKVKLVQENGQAEQAGFLIYMPVYRQLRGLDTLAQRQAALIGYAYAPFRVGDLVTLALHDELDGLAVTLYDTTDTLASNLLYPIVDGAKANLPPNAPPAYQTTIDVGNRLWTLQTRALPSYWQSVDHAASRLTLTFGMLLSVGMFLLLRMLASTRVQKDQTAHFRSVIELAPSALIMVNHEGCIEMVNSPMEQMFGYPREELLGQPVEMLIAPHQRGDHVGMRQGYTHNASQRPTSMGRDLTGLHKDGREIALEIGLSPLPTVAGQKTLCGFVDISARKQHANALLKASRDLERTNALAKVGGWEVDLRTNAITWSAETCRIHAVEPGYVPTLEQAILFYAPEARPIIQKAVEHGIATGQGWNLEMPLITANSEHIWVRAQGEVEYENGVAVRLVGAFQDITERKTHLDALSRRNQELDKFAYIASHDLKSPLRGIDQLATWIAEDLGTTIDPTAQEHLRLMRIRIKRMENLLDGLLAYARAGRVEGDPEPVDVKALVTDTFDLCHDHARFALHLGGDFPTLHTAKAPLELVLRNLINNAIKHHDKANGVITVTIKVVGTHLDIDVADDGPGIPADQVERAFGMFQTLRPRDEVEGSGIGLAIVKKTIEAMGGTIELLPNNPRGARFVLRWPVSGGKT